MEHPMRIKVSLAGLGLASLLAAAAGIGWQAFDAMRDKRNRAFEAYREGAWQEAEEVARSLIRSRPADEGLQRLLARLSARQGRDEAAEAIYRRLGVTRMEPEDLFLLGRGLLKRGELGPALAAFGAARDADPNHPETLEALAQYWLDHQALLDSLEAAKRLAEQPGWELRGLLALAHAKGQLLDPDGAAEALKTAFRLDPALKGAGIDRREAVKLLATSLLQAGRSAEAQTTLESDAELIGEAEGLWLLSRALLQQGTAGQTIAELWAKSAEIVDDDPMRQEPSPYVGSAACALCHPAQSRTQRQSHHAQTRLQADELERLPWPEGVVTDGVNPDVHHEVSRGDGTIRAEVRVEDRAFQAVVEYALGSGHQGRSFLARDRAGTARELRLSLYPEPPIWDRTMEHPPVPPDAAGYLGRPISEESRRKCLHCHATHFRAAEPGSSRPEARDGGIGCERCHGPGAHHIAAVEQQLPILAIARPRLATAAQILALCGQCHQAPGTVAASEPGFIRFQAPTFMMSRCYSKSGRFSCVTCHDPHRDASRSAADYELVCLRCHPTDASNPVPSAGSQEPGVWATCPVNPKSDCLECHMPAIRDAVPRAVFTDHRIRVRDDRPR